MKTKQFITHMLLAATLMQMPILAHALDIKINPKGDINIYKCPGKMPIDATPVTSFDASAATFTITSRANIPEAVVTVTKDGAMVSHEIMPIEKDYIIEYDFSGDETGEYEITIVVDGTVKSVDNIYVE